MGLVQRDLTLRTSAQWLDIDVLAGVPRVTLSWLKGPAGSQLTVRLPICLSAGPLTRPSFDPLNLSQAP